MIPKIIHYCWFGRSNLPSLATKCISSWKKYLPDYKLKLWNEDTFDISSVPFVKEAYESKKYAFVSDYVRLHALYHFGGIYMDTDVEVLRCLDDFLMLPGFSGFENDREVSTGIIACEKYNYWVKEQLVYYLNRKFILSNGRLDMTPNVVIISNIMEQNGFKLENGYQVYENCMHFFPKDYFCPKTSTGLINLTNNTFCIHHFSGSWEPISAKIVKYFYRNILGPKLTNNLVIAKRHILKKIGR